MDTVSAMIIINEIARADASIAQSVAAHNFAFLYPLVSMATEKQIETFVMPCINGGKIGALAVNEADGTSGALATTAFEDGEYYIINGSKKMITNLGASDYALVYAQTAPNAAGLLGNSVFLVDLHKTPGIVLTKAEDKMGLHGLSLDGMILDHARVHKSCLIGEKDQGFIFIGKTLELMSISNAAVALGIAERAYIEAVNYTKERKVNGSPMCELESVKLELAEIKMKLTWLKLLVFQTAYLQDIQDQNIGNYFLVTKYTVTETAKEICDRALQLFGGYGYMKGFIIERLYRDIRAYTIIGCSSEVHRSYISQGIFTATESVNALWE